jgi:hypothetical protein
MEELREINRLTRVSYDLAATKYDELFRDELDQKPYDRQLLDEFAGHFTPDSIIHDMGCGPSGHIGHYLHAKGLHVIGSDISERCIEVASSCHPEMEFLVMDMASLTLEDQSIDGVLSIDRRRPVLLLDHSHTEETGPAALSGVPPGVEEEREAPSVGEGGRSGRIPGRVPRIRNQDLFHPLSPGRDRPAPDRERIRGSFSGEAEPTGG